MPTSDIEYQVDVQGHMSVGSHCSAHHWVSRVEWKTISSWTHHEHTRQIFVEGIGHWRWHMMMIVCAPAYMRCAYKNKYYNQQFSKPFSYPSSPTLHKLLFKAAIQQNILIRSTMKLLHQLMFTNLIRSTMMSLHRLMFTYLKWITTDTGSSDIIVASTLACQLSGHIFKFFSCWFFFIDLTSQNDPV